MSFNMLTQFATYLCIGYLYQLCAADEEFPSGVKECLNGPFHKDTPSPETGFLECLPWTQESCCNKNLSHEIHEHRSKNLYNFHYDRCGLMSPQCEKFLKDEECFYQCEPYLSYFVDPDYVEKGYIRDVPICASYCDAWFEACKEDLTCVENWLLDFDYSANENHCPAGSKCQTFSHVYKNGKGLCEKMWKPAFVYETSNENCMIMTFKPTCQTNPNRCAHANSTCIKVDPDCDVTSKARNGQMSFLNLLSILGVTLAALHT